MGHYKKRGDVLLSTQEVALLLGATESELVHGLQEGIKVKGVTLPEPVSSRGVKRHFLYQDIIDAIDARQTHRSEA